VWDSSGEGLKWLARTQVVREHREPYRYLWDLYDQPALKWLGSIRSHIDMGHIGVMCFVCGT
jgi:hypothetical protein